MTETVGHPMHPGKARWDWYTAAIADVEPSTINDHICVVFGSEVRHASPRFGYGVCNVHSWYSHDSVRVLHGGAHDRVLVEASGSETPSVVSVLRSNWPHYVTRVDSALDIMSGWDHVMPVVLDHARRSKISTQVAGDWIDGQRGRTLYVGAPSSRSRIRCYEKGIQLGSDPSWVRVELQYRPDRQNRASVARMDPDAVWGTSSVARRVYEALEGVSVDAVPQEPGRHPDEERAWNALLNQYARTIAVRRARLGWAAVLWELKHQVDQRYPQSDDDPEQRRSDT